MKLELPAPIAGYFEADRSGDAEAVSQHFTSGAVVRDEGRDYSGPDAIKEWKTASSVKYIYTVEPFEIAQEPDRTIVTAHLVGDFPGSPIDLRYRFTLDGQQISTLEIGI